MVSFDGNLAQISDDQGHYVHLKREKLDGLWIGYAWSKSNVAIHARISHIQIDDQLEHTLFPTIFHPVITKFPETHPCYKIPILKSKYLMFLFI